MANPHVGECLKDVCEHCLDFQKGWSAAGTELALIKRIKERMLDKSGRAFAAHDDKAANLYREIAKDLFAQEEDAVARLHVYMKRAGHKV